MKRGDIYLVDLEPTAGHEQRGQRIWTFFSDIGTRICPENLAIFTNSAIIELISV